MTTDRVYQVDYIATEMINKLCVDPEKNLSILKINNGEEVRHVIFWSENRLYYEKEISKIEYEALKNAGFPCGL